MNVSTLITAAKLERFQGVHYMKVVDRQWFIGRNCPSTQSYGQKERVNNSQTLDVCT